MNNLLLFKRDIFSSSLRLWSMNGKEGGWRSDVRTVCGCWCWWGGGWVRRGGVCVMERVDLWCNAPAAVLWNSMKAEITQTRLVEQASTEHLQSQILFNMCVCVCVSFYTHTGPHAHTHPHRNTQRLTFFCCFLSKPLSLFLLLVFHTKSPLFFICTLLNFSNSEVNNNNWMFLFVHTCSNLYFCWHFLHIFFLLCRLCLLFFPSLSLAPCTHLLWSPSVLCLPWQRQWHFDLSSYVTAVQLG